MIELKGVNKSFVAQGGAVVEALRDTNLEVGENEFVTVVGRSGCGKSTLLKLVSGLMEPSTGEVRIRDEVLTAPYPDVGFVFQSPVLLPWLTVWKNVLFSIEMLGLNPRDFESRAEELLQAAGLAGFEGSYPRELSGGMQQRVSICRALIHDPSILLMDEPFGALDAMTREEMSVQLLRIWESTPKTIVFVTHSIPEAVLLADRVIVMTPRPGQIAKVLDVNLPRPRGVEVEDDPQFNAMKNEIRSVIFGESETSDAEQVR